MSELHDEIRNMSAVLELLHPGARVAQRPVLRLVSNHLQLLARVLDRCGDDHPVPAPPLAGRGGAPAFACCPPEAGHVRQ